MKFAPIDIVKNATDGLIENLFKSTSYVPTISLKGLVISPILIGMGIFLIVFSLHHLTHSFLDTGQTLESSSLTVKDYFNLAVVIPISETLVFQVLPILFLIKQLNISTRTSVFVSAALFSIVHSDLGVAVFLINGLIGGLLLATCYSYWMKYSYFVAFAITMLAHSTHNTLTMVTVLVN